MIDHVGSVTVFVEDQDRAKEFYTEKLGFDLRLEAPLGPGSNDRWLAVAPPGAQTEIILYRMDGNWKHYREAMGNTQAFSFTVTDMDATHAHLKAQGVNFVHEPDRQPWGTYALIEDSEGNRLMLVEQG